MSSQVVFSLTITQARALDALTRQGFRANKHHTELITLERRNLVQQVNGEWRLTSIGHVAQALVRRAKLHQGHERSTRHE